MMNWKKRNKSKGQTTFRGLGNESSSILPSGFFSYENDLVTINQGPFSGIKFSLGKIKIRKDLLTGAPRLLYNYEIVDYAGQDPVLVEPSEQLSRIIGAIVVDLLIDEIFIGQTKLEIAKEWQTESNQ
jgi:hypothetical protein